MQGSDSVDTQYAPYISLVVTARNDDHGGNLLGRMQVFLDAWINQAKRHNLPSELILVEWNPPPGKDRLVTALRWPADTGPCQVRIIEVPAEIHARYHHSSVLALYQMIAKNVGIRRARGEFILATNIDVVFSDELVGFLAARCLEKGRMYRIDRTDVMSDVPLNATLDEQLAYCRSHVIRLCAREGIFPVTADGYRKNEEHDITAPGSGIHFGDGWFSVERWNAQEPFRWISDEAEITFSETPPAGGVLSLDVEVGPGIHSRPPVLEALDGSGSVVAKWIVEGRSKLELVVPPFAPGTRRSFRLRVPGGGLPVVNDPRILNFRIFQCDWVEFKPQAPLPFSSRAVMQESRPLITRLAAATRAGGIGSVLQSPGIVRRAIRLLGIRGEDIFERGLEYRIGLGWHELEHAGNEKFRWASQDAQLAIRTTEDARSLALVVEPGPALGYRPFTLLVRDAGGEAIARASVNGVTYVDVPLRVPPRTLVTLVLTAEGGGTRIGEDPRTLNFRVHACGGGLGKPKTDGNVFPSARFWLNLTHEYCAPEVDWATTLEKWQGQIKDMGKPAFLHLSACGDFTLMARAHWHDLRGYAELDLFSMHLDSFLCCAAHNAGVREEILKAPMRIYHIEHGIGSGWTPEGKGQLYERLAQRRIQNVSYEEVVWSIAQMRSLGAPVIFNLDDWGLVAFNFPEIGPLGVPYVRELGT